MTRRRDLQRYAWQRLRAAAIAHAGGRCQRCGDPATVAHHRHHVEDGGEPYPPLDGLEALCRPCHERHHGRRRDPDPAWAAMLDELDPDSP